MAKVNVANTLGKVFAAIGSVVFVLFTGASLFFPSLLTNAAQQLIGGLGQYQTADGSLRPDVVSAQVNIFILMIVGFAIVAGAALVAAHYWTTWREACSVAAGGNRNKLLRWIPPIVIGLICILVGFSLPSTIFDATDKMTLARDFRWAAIPALCGIIIFVVSFIFGGGFYFWLKRSSQKQRNKVRKAFA